MLLGEAALATCADVTVVAGTEVRSAAFSTRHDPTIRAFRAGPTWRCSRSNTADQRGRIANHRLSGTQSVTPPPSSVITATASRISSGARDALTLPLIPNGGRPDRCLAGFQTDFGARRNPASMAADAPANSFFDLAYASVPQRAARPLRSGTGHDQCRADRYRAAQISSVAANVVPGADWVPSPATAASRRRSSQDVANNRLRRARARGRRHRRVVAGLAEFLVRVAWLSPRVKA